MTSTEITSDQLDEIQKRLDSIPFAHLLGLQLQEVGQGTVTLRMDVKEDLKRNNGIVHGGAIASLIDSATAFAIISLDPSQVSLTIDLTINYLRPVSDGSVVATAKVLRAGRRVIVVSAEAFDNAGKLVATALSTYIRN